MAFKNINDDKSKWHSITPDRKYMWEGTELTNICGKVLT